MVPNTGPQHGKRGSQSRDHSVAAPAGFAPERGSPTTNISQGPKARGYSPGDPRAGRLAPLSHPEAQEGEERGRPAKSQGGGATIQGASRERKRPPTQDSDRTKRMRTGTASTAGKAKRTPTIKNASERPLGDLFDLADQGQVPMDSLHYLRKAPGDVIAPLVLLYHHNYPTDEDTKRAIAKDSLMNLRNSFRQHEIHSEGTTRKYDRPSSKYPLFKQLKIIQDSEDYQNYAARVDIWQFAANLPCPDLPVIKDGTVHMHHPLVLILRSAANDGDVTYHNLRDKDALKGVPFQGLIRAYKNNPESLTTCLGNATYKKIQDEWKRVGPGACTPIGVRADLLREWSADPTKLQRGGRSPARRASPYGKGSSPPRSASGTRRPLA